MNEGYSKVFVALDGTEQQDFVLARAIKVAANNKAKLYIGHVIDSTALESAGVYPLDLVNGLEAAFRESIAAQVEEAKASENIPEVEVIIRAGAFARPSRTRCSMSFSPTSSCAAHAGYRRLSTRCLAPSRRSCCAAPSATSSW